MNITFENPQYLLLALILPFLYLFIVKFKKKSSIRFSSFKFLMQSKPTGNYISKNLPVLIRLMALFFLITALSRPQLSNAEKEYETEGIDIILALDISGSMKAEDFQPANRLEVAKEEAKKFIIGREHDRIGLVVFAKQSFTQCPLTLDYDVILNILDEIQIGLIKDGTAIGLAIANAVNRLRDSKAKSKVIIVITDGENNAGQIDPITAAKLAKTLGIKIYTIGVGKGGLVPYPVDDPIFGRRYTNIEVKIDEDTLIKIADLTGGQYFRARDQLSLKQIYEKIDQLEKTEIKVKEYESFYELFHYVLYPALMFLLIELFMTNVTFLKIP